MWQISYPPANGASLDSYLSKNGCFGTKTGKMGPIKTAMDPSLQTIIDVKIQWAKEEREREREREREGACVCVLATYLASSSCCHSKETVNGTSKKRYDLRFYFYTFNK